MKALFATAALALPLALTLVLAGTAAAEPRNLTGFTGVDASAGVDVQVVVGAGFSVDVSGPGADRIVTEVRAGVLRIHPEQHWGMRIRRAALVRVTMPRLDSLSASSGAEVHAEGVRADTIALDASSGGELTIVGACGNVDADASSGSHLNAARLQCERGSVEASSGARADVHVSGALDVDASSGGRVYAGGGAQVGNISLSSGGTLHRS
jgi:hypothetical protein